MMIRVLYNDNRSGTVKDYQLNDLISAGKIVAFRRSSGWATIGHDPVRGKGGEYHGPERRNRPEKSVKAADFFG